MTTLSLVSIIVFEMCRYYNECSVCVYIYNGNFEFKLTFKLVCLFYVYTFVVES